MALYVNNEKIDPAEMENEAAMLKPQHDQVFAEKPEAERETQLQEWARENVIERALLRQAALKAAQEVPLHEVEAAYGQLMEQHGGEDNFYQTAGLEKDRMDDVKQDIAKQMQFERFIEGLTAHVEAPTDEAVKKHYNAHIDRFTVPEMIKASHIVKHVQPGTDINALRLEMEDFLKQLHAGADFAALAEGQSDCQDQGGDLGYFPRGQMVQEFEDVVFAMDVGQVSEIFQTPFGFHIAKVFDKQAAHPAPLEEARQTIVEELTNEARQKAIEDFVDAEKEKAVIEEK